MTMGIANMGMHSSSNLQMQHEHLNSGSNISMQQHIQGTDSMSVAPRQELQMNNNYSNNIAIMGISGQSQSHLSASGQGSNKNLMQQLPPRIPDPQSGIDNSHINQYQNPYASGAGDYGQGSQFDNSQQFNDYE